MADRAIDCPLQRAADSPQVERPDRFCFGQGAAPARAERILVVDQPVHVAALTVNMLVELGYVADWCVNLRDLYDRLRDGPPVQLLLLPRALSFPDDGQEVARHAQAMQPTLRVLLTQGSAHAARLPAPGPYECLAKPYGPAKLHRKVRLVLDRVDDAMPVDPGPGGPEGTRGTAAA